MELTIVPKSRSGPPAFRTPAADRFVPPRIRSRGDVRRAIITRLPRAYVVRFPATGWPDGLLPEGAARSGEADAFEQGIRNALQVILRAAFVFVSGAFR
jgi:hypothetical protein